MPALRKKAEPSPATLSPAELHHDPVASARAAGLRYVTDTKPGIQRQRWRSGFRYLTPDGKPLRDSDDLSRIKSLAIPPAWNEVWICPNPNGHLQATGRDARGRKQSRYHPRWREVRDETKYERMTLFASVLPRIRERVEHDLALPGLPRNKVLATIVRLMETTFIRVGNTEYARENKSYGLTTMRNKHVDVEGSTLRFTFQGKSRVHHTIDVQDRRLARIVKRCMDIPGYELFQYLDGEGEPHTIDSADVNEYLQEISGEHITAKDFRTWAGTVLACMMLQEAEPFESDTQGKKTVLRAIESVASRLGNTPSVCRKCYVHPAILDCYMKGEMAHTVQHRIEEEIADSTHPLRPEEAAVLQLLEQRLEAQAAH
jgi:DNA topoisomerase-1